MATNWSIEAVSSTSWDVQANTYGSNSLSDWEDITLSWESLLYVWSDVNTTWTFSNKAVTRDSD